VQRCGGREEAKELIDSLAPTTAQTFGSLKAGTKFSVPGTKRRFLKLSYPANGNPDCVAVELDDGSRVNFPDDHEVLT
jgi:hypothetical protein